MRTPKFDPDKDIPDLSEKVILITEGTAELGKESALALARHNPSHIYLAGHDSQKGTTVVNVIKDSFPTVNATFLPCDLASLASIEQAAKQFTSAADQLHVLMCNTSVAALSPGMTEDGYEAQFGTNHVGHALLIKLLLPTLCRTAERPDSAVRIVMNALVDHRVASRCSSVSSKDQRTLQDCIIPGADKWNRSRQSNMANMFYTAELARRYPSISSISIHSGMISTARAANVCFINRALAHVTNIGTCKTPEDGLRNQLWAATAMNEDVVNGAFYESVAVLSAHDRLSENQKLATQLWDWTEKELQAFNP